MKSANHPIWSILRLFILMVTLIGILYINANNFDITEWRTIIQMFLVAGSVEGGLVAIQKVFNKSSN